MSYDTLIKLRILIVMLHYNNYFHWYTGNRFLKYHPYLKFGFQRIRRGIFACLAHIKVLIATNWMLFTELKNLFTFSRYSIFKFWKCKGLYGKLKLLMRFKDIYQNRMISAKNGHSKPDFWPSYTFSNCPGPVRPQFLILGQIIVQ